MKRKIEIMAGCLVTIFLIIMIIIKLGHLVRPTNTDVAFNVIDTFHSMPKNSFEVIGYGSSHMWKGLDPMEMYKNYGIGAYNYGCNWQRINTTELFILESFLTQSPKVILIETYRVNEVLQDTNIIGEIYYTKGLTDFEGKERYLEECFGDDYERYLSYYIPLCAFHDNWINISKNSFLKNSNTKDFFASMGYNYSKKTTSINIPDLNSFKQEELSADAVKVLDRIVSVCREKNIDIIFYTHPYGAKYKYSDAMKKYAEQNGCVYIDMFECIEEVGIDGETDFQDKGHLNASGAAKVANFLGEYIVNNYDVTDMRTVENNIWEQNLKDKN